MNHFSQFSRLISINERLTEIYYNRGLAANGIGWGQQFYIEYIYDHPGATPHEMVKHICVDKATLTKVIRKLLSLDFITVEGDEKDGRVKHLFLTEKAVPAALKIKELHAEFFNIISSSSTADELSATESVLEKMNDNIRLFFVRRREAKKSV